MARGRLRAPRDDDDVERPVGPSRRASTPATASASWSAEVRFTGKKPSCAAARRHRAAGCPGSLRPRPGPDPWTGRRVEGDAVDGGRGVRGGAPARPSRPRAGRRATRRALGSACGRRRAHRCASTRRRSGRCRARPRGQPAPGEPVEGGGLAGRPSPARRRASGVTIGPSTSREVTAATADRTTHGSATGADRGPPGDVVPDEEARPSRPPRPPRRAGRAVAGRRARRRAGARAARALMPGVLASSSRPVWRSRAVDELVPARAAAARGRCPRATTSVGPGSAARRACAVLRRGTTGSSCAVHDQRRARDVAEAAVARAVELHRRSGSSSTAPRSRVRATSTRASDADVRPRRRAVTRRGRRARPRHVLDDGVDVVEVGSRRRSASMNAVVGEGSSSLAGGRAHEGDARRPGRGGRRRGRGPVPPDIDRPTTCARSTPSASRMPTASAARSLIA